MSAHAFSSLLAPAFDGRAWLLLTLGLVLLPRIGIERGHSGRGRQSLIFHGLLTAVSSLDENDCPWGPLGGRYPHASLSWNEVVPSVLPQEETCSSGRPAAWWSAQLRAPTPSTFISRNRPLTSCFCASHSRTQPYCLLWYLFDPRGTQPSCWPGRRDSGSLCLVLFPRCHPSLFLLLRVEPRVAGCVVPVQPGSTNNSLKAFLLTGLRNWGLATRMKEKENPHSTPHWADFWLQWFR